MKKFKKILSVLLCFALLLSTVGVISYAEFSAEKAQSQLSFVAISDPHFYPDVLTGNNCEAYQKYCEGNTKLFAQSETIIRTAIETAVKRNSDLKYVLIPGDLTKDSEYVAHVEFAKLLLEYEEKYGLEFIVTNGNHDLSSLNSVTFESGEPVKTKAMEPYEFFDVYAELGYDLAYERYIDYFKRTYPGESTDVQNLLSYVVDLDENYRLIVIDSCGYQFSEPYEDHTGGEISDEAMLWIEGIAADCRQKGKTPMVMLHHGLAAHMETEPSITFAFPLDNYIQVAEKFASWGIHYAFTGHLHTDDLACTINDDGEVLYDCEVASVTGYPFTYREITITTDKNGESEMSFNSVDFDDKVKMTWDGKTYDNGTYKYAAFKETYGGFSNEEGNPDAAMFMSALVKSLIDEFIDGIRAEKGIDPYLKTMGIDLSSIIGGFLEPYIGDGIAIGGYNIFSVDNIMWFVNDLLDQVYKHYLENPQNLYDLLTQIIGELGKIVVSDYPCDYFLEEFGFGSKTEKGTLADLVLTVMVYWYTGNEDNRDNEFLQDVLSNFRSGALTKVVFDKLVDLLLHDVIEDALLSKLEIRLGKLFNDDAIGNRLGDGVNYLVDVILRGDVTYMNLVNTVFALEILPYSDLYDTLDKLLLSKYLTESQFEGTGTFIAYVLNDFTYDVNPILKGDSGNTYSTSKVEVPVTRGNYRLPTMVSVTMGEDSESSAYINWFSKYTVGGDIEIYKAEEEPTFTGTPTEKADFTIEIQSEQIRRSYPGLDIGIAGFITYEFPMNRHTVTLTDLEPGATYYYRVGDAEKGWWSETGRIRTADGSDSTTFLHMTDPQSQSEVQYERAWASVTEKAFELYPEAAFIINTGDLVDHADNTKQWQWMFDTASTELMKTFMMPTSGNHEESGEDALVKNFVIANAPEQNTANGIYYSFDYNNIHIAVLNTNDLNEDEALSEKQIEWLKNDMNSSDAQWKFVALHKAVYSQGSHYKDDDVCAIRSQLQGLMPELDIDLVFQGHDHVYMRTSSLKDNALTGYERTYLNHDGAVYKAQIKPEGTTYVISGTSGVKTYITNDVTATDKYFPRAEKIFSVDAAMFSAIEIEDGVLYFTAYNVTDYGEKSEVVDRFAIQKDTAQGDVAEGYTEPPAEEIPEETFAEKVQSFLKTLEKILKVIFNICKLYFLDVKA